MNEDFNNELSRLPVDDNDGKVDKLDRMADQPDSAAGESFVFSANAGIRTGQQTNATVSEQLPALQRASLSTQGRREKDLTAVLRTTKDIHRSLNLPRSLLVRPTITVTVSSVF